VTATARKIATIYYRMLAERQQFVELGQDWYENHYRDRQLRSLNRKAAQLGYSLVPAESTN